MSIFFFLCLCSFTDSIRILSPDDAFKPQTQWCHAANSSYECNRYFAAANISTSTGVFQHRLPVFKENASLPSQIHKYESLMWPIQINQQNLNHVNLTDVPSSLPVIGHACAALSALIAGISEIHRKDYPQMNQTISGTVLQVSSMPCVHLAPQYILLGVAEAFTTPACTHFSLCTNAQNCFKYVFTETLRPFISHSSTQAPLSLSVWLPATSGASPCNSLTSPMVEGVFWVLFWFSSFTVCQEVRTLFFRSWSKNLIPNLICIGTW